MKLVDLPPEVILKTLRYEDVTCEDLVSVGNTCRRLKRLVSADSHLWMKKMCKRWPDLISLKNTDSIWYDEYKNMMTIFAQCRKKIAKLSPTYYSAPLSLSDCHIRNDFLPICIMNNGNGMLYLLIFLRDLCLKEVSTDNKTCSRFYNLTNQYYAGIVLEYFNKCLLRKEWSMMLDETDNSILTPEKVILFFNQWMEPKYKKIDKQFDMMMSSIAETIISFLPDKHPLHKINDVERKTWSSRLISDNKYDSDSCIEVINLASNVISNQKHLISTDCISSRSLFIRNVIEEKQSNDYYSSFIFEAVLRRCGIRCDVVHVRNYHLLIWRENWEERSSPYFVIPFSGILIPTNYDLDYSPLNLLAFIANDVADICTENEIFEKKIKRSMELITFLRPDDAQKWILLGELYLNMKNDTRALERKLKMILDSDRQNFVENSEITQVLCKINKANEINSEKSKSKKIKHHDRSIKFAVGLVCYHIIDNFMCVINGWDPICVAEKQRKMCKDVCMLSFHDQQPFYSVVAEDFTNRYVAQEHLMFVNKPSRLIDLEEELGVNFTHFNGAFYVPNAETNEEYPNDDYARFKMCQQFM